MTGDSDGDRTLLVDASTFISLAEVDAVDLLDGLDGQVTMPEAVVGEITSEPAESALDRATGKWLTTVETDEWLFMEYPDTLEDGSESASPPERAASHLGTSNSPEERGGDVWLLAAGLETDDPVVVSDDKPLRETCKALSIPVSGSICVLIRAVEGENIAPEDAKDKLYAMDEVGARLSASLVRRAERLIDDASEQSSNTVE